MTKSVADKTPIPSQTWRRHTDPPGLWIGVVTGSIVLHLLALWFIRSQINLLQQQYSDNAVPIDIVEISPQQESSEAKPQAQAKPASPVPNSPTAETVKPPPTTEDRSAIALTDKKEAIASKPSSPTPPPKPQQTTSAEQKTATVTPQPTTKPEFTPKVTPTPSPLFPENQNPIPTPSPLFPENQNPIPTPSPQFPDNTNTNTSEPENPFSEEQLTSPTTGGEKIAQAPRNLTGETPEDRKNSVPPPIQKTPEPLPSELPKPITEKSPPPPPTEGGISATWKFLPQEQQESLMQDPLPEGLILPEHLGNNEKLVPSLLINQNEDIDIQPVEFLASLVIDRNGNFIQAEVIDPAIPAAKRSEYEELANTVFQGEKFQPAHYADSTKQPENTQLPEWTNRFVILKIQRSQY